MAKACGLCRALILGRAALSPRAHFCSSSSTPPPPNAPADASPSPNSQQTDPPPSPTSPSVLHSIMANLRDVKDSASSSSSREPPPRTWPRESGFEDIFSAPPSTPTQAPVKAFWSSLLNKPKDGTAKDEESWDFLKADAPRDRLQGSTSDSSSYRKLGDAGSGFDFLSEALDLPAKDTERPEQDPGEENILHNASFNLLRDSFRKTSMQADREGSSPVWEALSSQETWTKPLDSRSLPELERSFYTVQDRAPKKEEKEWTYEELGEKLRQVRPPKEQQLTGAMGLSFKELRDRLEKMEQLEKEVPEPKAMVDYKELRDSLEELRSPTSPKAVSSRNQLSYEELAFLNTMGTGVNARPKIEYIPPKDDLLKKYFAPEQMSSKELLKLEIKKLKKEFQMHDSDSGSSQVQIAILTAKINNLNRHLREGPNYKRDKHSRKGLNDMVQYRKRLLRYLRRRDWDVYCNVLTKLNLDDVILEKRA